MLLLHECTTIREVRKNVKKMMKHEEERLQLLISEQLIDMSCHYNLLFLKASVYNVGCSSIFFYSSSSKAHSPHRTSPVINRPTSLKGG